MEMRIKVAKYTMGRHNFVETYSTVGFGRKDGNKNTD